MDQRAELDKKELEELIKAGAKTITLGKRILRTETASIVVVSNLIYERNVNLWILGRRLCNKMANKKINTEQKKLEKSYPKETAKTTTKILKLKIKNKWEKQQITIQRKQ